MTNGKILWNPLDLVLVDKVIIATFFFQNQFIDYNWRVNIASYELR